MKTPLGFASLRSARGGVLTKLLFFFVFCFIALAVIWVLFLPSIVARVVGSRTGFALTTAELSLNPLNGSLHIRELRLTNPTSFPSADFVSLRGFEADVELKSLFSDRLVIEKAALDLESLTLVRLEDGTLNAKLFGDRLAGPASTSPAPAEPAPQAQPAGAGKQFIIKHLDVKIGRFRVENYADGKRSAREINLNLSQTYENVTDAKQLLTGPMLANLSSLGSVLINVLPSDWNQVWGKGLESGRQFLKELGKKTSNALRSAAETLEEKSKP